VTGTASTRPRFHFTPTTGWINDPHGITFRDGGYDVFFQYVPDAVWRPDCRWGHARGGDLLSLRELPIAIAPGEGDDGVWTGSLVVDDGGGVRAFYTSISIPEFGIGRVRTAVPAGEDWITWEKGPVVVEAPDGLDLVAFRDPFVRREGDRWRMFVGAGGRDGTAMALTYVCEDGLGTWRYDGVALRRSTDEVDPVWTGSLWECPQVFPIGDRWAMVSSVWDADRLHYVVYALGLYAEGRFDAETWGRLTYGPSYYAPSLFFDREQRPCLSFWMRGIADAGAGWAGAHSVPHLLSLAGDRLRAMPHPDIERYQQGSTGGAVPAGVQAVDISWDPTPGDRLAVSRGPGEVATFECRDGELGVRIGQSGWTVPGGDAVRIIVDGPVLEVATERANFGAAIPTPPGGLSITAHGTPPHVHTLLAQDGPHTGR
jgi:beta-fructofuranosidase